MKTVRYLMLLSLLTTLALPGLLLGQGQINLSNTNQQSELPAVIARPNGEIMVVWGEGYHFNADSVLHYRVYKPGSGWTEAKVAVPRRYSSAFPQLAVDSKGDVHMSYMDGASSYHREIFYAKYVNGNWTTPEMIFESPQLNSTWPRIDVEGNRIYILWCHNYTPPVDGIRQRQDIYLQEKTDGGTWPSTPQNVSMQSGGVSVHCWLDVINGNVYAAWMDDIHHESNWNIYYNERINGTWGNSVHVNPGWNQYTPCVLADNSGYVHLIYSNKGNPVWYQKKTGSNWSAPKEISTAKTSYASMLYMDYSHGMLNGVWRQREGEGDYMFYANGTTSGQWNDPIKVSQGGESEYPGLDVDKDGKVHIVYSDTGKGGDRDIFYVRVDQVTSYPVASFTAQPTQGNPPLQVSFDASASYDPDGNIVSYAWNFGDGNKASGIQYVHTYTNRGTHTATLTVADDEGQSSSSAQQIVVGTPPVAQFTANPTSGPSPLNVKFDASTSFDADGTIVSYNWNFGDGTSGAGKQVSHTYTNNVNRMATLTVKDNNGLTSSASTEIKVSKGPAASFKVNPKQGPAPLTAKFDASNSKPSDRQTGRIVSYEWDFDDGSSAQGVNVSHRFSKAGLYSVTLEITDNLGASDSSIVDIICFSKPSASFTASTTEGVAPVEVHFNASRSDDEDGEIISYRWTFGDGTSGTGKTISHTFTKGGDLTITLTVMDDDGWMDTASTSIKIIERPYPPHQLSLKKIAQRGLFFANYLNILEWKDSGKNQGKIKTVKFLIFKKDKSSPQSFVYQATVDANTFIYEDVNVTSAEDQNNYIYGIRAVDAAGRESDMRTIDASLQ
jgi:PKD repeat protein